MVAEAMADQLIQPAMPPEGSRLPVGGSQAWREIGHGHVGRMKCKAANWTLGLGSTWMLAAFLFSADFT